MIHHSRLRSEGALVKIRSKDPINKNLFFKKKVFPLFPAMLQLYLPTRHNFKRTFETVFQHLRMDESDEVEVGELSDYCSTGRDTETCHTERGYEADSEFTSDDAGHGKGCGVCVCVCVCLSVSD